MIGPDHPRTALLPDSAVLRCTEGVIRRTVEWAGGVILGRAAAIVLRDHPGAFYVRLDGDPHRRVRQAMTLQGMTERDAREALGRNDNARTAYVRHFSWSRCVIRAAALHRIAPPGRVAPRSRRAEVDRGRRVQDLHVDRPVTVDDSVA